MIPLMKVHVPSNIGKTVQDVWDSGFVTEGEYSDLFEEKLGNYIGNENVCLTNSCTSSLSLVSKVLDIGIGDEVISTAMTCMATNEPFFNDGAKMVFADINPSTGNICPKSIESKITNKTKAIIVVHWGGQPADLDEINEIGRKYNVKVIEDAAHALRSSYKGVRIGSHSDYVCFSFQAVKHLSTADGGAVACKSKEDAERIRKIRWFGLDRKFNGPSRWEQDIFESGFKMHMNNMNASIGILQMNYIDKIIDSHVANSKFLQKYICNNRVKKLSFLKDRESSSWIYTLLIDDRDSFRSYMKKMGIQADIAHVSNLKYSVFKDFRNSELVGLEEFDKNMINIPCGWWLDMSSLEYIVDTVNRF